MNQVTVGIPVSDVDMTAWCNLALDQLVASFGVVKEDVNASVRLFDDSYVIVGLSVVDSFFGANNEIVAFDKSEQNVGLWLCRSGDWRFSEGDC